MLRRTMVSARFDLASTSPRSRAISSSMDRIFKRPFLWSEPYRRTGRVVNFLFWLMRNPLLYQAARPESGREAREVFLIAALARTQSERRRRLALATGFGSQIVWNRSKRCAGARVGRPRWLRILMITGGSSMVALRRRLRTGDDLQAAAAVGAVFDVDVDDPFEQPGPTDARRRALRLSVLAGGLGGTLWRSGNDLTAQLGVGRQNSMEADQM
jgi:hypothetical protein